MASNAESAAMKCSADHIEQGKSVWNMLLFSDVARVYWIMAIQSSGEMVETEQKVVRLGLEAATSRNTQRIPRRGATYPAL